MKVNIKMNIEMGKELIFIVMGINMLENGKKEKNMERAFFIITIKADMKANL